MHMKLALLTQSVVPGQQNHLGASPQTSKIWTYILVEISKQFLHTLQFEKHYSKETIYIVMEV